MLLVSKSTCFTLKYFPVPGNPEELTWTLEQFLMHRVLEKMLISNTDVSGSPVQIDGEALVVSGSDNNLQQDMMLALNKDLRLNVNA